MSDRRQNAAAGPRVPLIGWAIAFVIFLGVVALAYSLLQSTHIRDVPMEKYGKAPEFTLTDQTGKPFSSKELKGKVWVASFIFTTCKGPCPLVTSRMADLNLKLDKARKEGKGVELVSFTVDPETDTPEVLAEYGKSTGADPQYWKFLTGPKPEIERVVIKGLYQALVKGTDGAPIHSTRLVLVDKDGEIRGFEDSTNPEAPQKLLLDIGALIRAPAAVDSKEKAK